MSAGAWKWVPAEPTDEMLLAPGALRTDGKLARIHRQIWCDMWTAAPTKPPAGFSWEQLAEIRGRMGRYASFVAAPLVPDAERSALDVFAASAAPVVGLSAQDKLDAALAALEHPLLRRLLGDIEDSNTPEATRLWSLVSGWAEVRDAAILAAGSKT